MEPKDVNALREAVMQIYRPSDFRDPNISRSEGRKSYLEKLKDPRWQKKRLKIFERDEWSCQNCASEEKTLCVHHRYYLQGSDPWEYPDEALVTLCEECHKEETENRPTEEQSLLRALRVNFYAADIQQLAQAFSNMPLLHLPMVVASVYAWALKRREIQSELINKYFEYLERKKPRN